MLFGTESRAAPIEQIAEARTRFSELQEQAASGDVEAVRELFEVSRRLLDLYQDALGSSEAYFTQEGAILAALEGLGDTLPQTDIATIATEVGGPQLSIAQTEDITSTIRAGDDRIASLLSDIRTALTNPDSNPFSGNFGSYYDGGFAGPARTVSGRVGSFARGFGGGISSRGLVLGEVA